MKRLFTIKPSYNPGRGHNHFPQRKYPVTHPYLYEAFDSQGWVVYLLSKRDDYADHQKVLIDCTLLSNGNYFLDNTSPNSVLHTRPSDRHRQRNTPPPGKVNSDVIVLVDTVMPKGTLTEITGKIFYVDPRLKDLTEQSLRDAFKDNAKITVLTDVRQYNFHAGNTFIFEKLRDVTVANNEITARDGYLPQSP
jgi:hypothetical protein